MIKDKAKRHKIFVELVTEIFGDVPYIFITNSDEGGTTLLTNLEDDAVVDGLTLLTKELKDTL